MPPEPLPWDRKDFFKERKHERSSDSLGPASRWRETPHHASSSARDFTRGGSAEFRSRPQGHGKQGGWHLFSEEINHGFTPSRTTERILDDESCRPSGSRGDGKYSRNSREPLSFSQKDWRGHSRETGASPNGPGRPHDVSDQRSVNDMLTYNSNPHSDFINTWDQIKDQNDKTDGVHGLGTGQRPDRENSLGSIDWKPLKWTRSGSLSSRGSGFSHSSSSKSIGVDVNESKTEVQPRYATPLQSPSGDAVACATSAPPYEETSSKKKPRLGWGEGLAKYEKKKVGGLYDSATKSGTVVFGGTESIHSHITNLADKSPGITGFSDCASPATPSSVGCSSSPGVEEKPFVKVVNNDNDTSNLIGSPSLVSWSDLDGLAFNLENVELTSITNLSSSISELLQSDDVNLVDSSFVRSTAMNKLLVLKGDISKVLEVTESEIDLLENELKSLISDSGSSCPCPVSSSSLPAKPCEQLGLVSISIPRPAPLQLVSSGDMIVEKAVGVLEEENAEVKGEDVDSPGTVTSKFIEPISSVKAASTSNMGKHGGCSDVLEQSRSRSLGMKCLVYGSNEQKKEGVSASADGTHLIANQSCVPLSTDESLHCYREDSRLYDLILASNKDSSNRASNVFNKLLPSNQYIDIPRASSVSCCQNDSLLKEKFAKRKRFLKFKERVMTLKYRAFQHLWKEDLRLLSMKKYRAKSQKKFELSSRTAHSGHQKHRSSFRSRFSSPAGNLSLVPATEIINFTSKLLSDSQAKLFRNTLKMPALILDKNEKISRFISNNCLVEDPCAVEKERARINPWTPEEKEVFMDKLSTFGKEFRKIASFLDHKTTADCIEFYYKNHKSDCFQKTKKKPEFEKKGKCYSTNGYLVTSGERWNREMNAASLDMLGKASAVAANADDGMENQLKGTARWVSGDYKTPRGDKGIFERSSSLSIFGNERETVAADVLAGICGSLSSEAMSSCITSSFDPGEGYKEWKCQKVGSLMRRPLTAEVTQDIDDETCSDDSCGEMDSTDWTDQEKSIFIQAVSSYGKDFTRISRCVRTRSRDQCKIFFSKARKCLGLDMVCPRSGNEGMPASEDTSGGGGSDAEDACVVETGTVVRSDKSGFKLDEDMQSDLNMNHESDPVATLNLQTDQKIVEENDGRGELDCKDPVNAVVGDCQLQGKLQLDFDPDSNIENGADGKHLSVQCHGIEVFPTEAGQEGNHLKQSASVEEGNNQCLSICAEIKSEALVEVSAEPLGTEREGKEVMPMQGDNSDANARGVSGLDCTFRDSGSIENNSHLDADTNSSSGFAVNLEHEPEIALELDSVHNAHVISLQSDNFLVRLNSMPQDSAASQYEITLNQDPSTTLDPQKIKDEQSQKSTSANDYSHSQHLSVDSLSEHVESSQIVRDYPLQVSAKKEMNGNISSKKPASFQSLPKNFHSDQYLSQDCYLQKCNNSKAHSLVAELPSQLQTRDQLRPNSQSSSDVEKPCRNGDVKLFGQILTHPLSQQKLNPGTHENEDKGNQHPKLSSKSFNPKISGTHSVDANFVPTRFDRNNYLDLENLPMRSYGFWDGNRIQTGFSSLPDSAILLAKYPAAFSNYPTTSSKTEQPLHSVVKSSECNVNGVSVFPRREIGSNGVAAADYQTYRNRDGTKGQPFTVDMKQRRQDLLFSEMQRRNGFDTVSSIQQQARGVVGINVVGRGGILVGGACTGVSDPVAAIKMHYAKAEQYNGQAGGIISEEDSWRGKGDIGR